MSPTVDGTVYVPVSGADVAPDAAPIPLLAVEDLPA